MSVTFPPPAISVAPGGNASALARDGSKITMSGTGTFAVDQPDKVTGGGAWITRSPLGAVTGLGTYQVVELLKFDEIPFQFPAGAFVDTIGKLEDVRLGLAFLRILYSDGSKGLLTVMCQDAAANQPATEEGVTASKGFVNYWSREGFQFPINADFTVFHVMR